MELSGRIGRTLGQPLAPIAARLRKEMAIDMLLELTGHHPLLCHHHDKEEHRVRLWKEKKAESEPHAPPPFQKTPAMPAMETQPMASKPAPAEQAQAFEDEGATLQPIQPLASLADEVADEGLAQQPPEVTPANAPAVLQPIQCQGQALADEVADEGHAQQPLEVTPASAPAAGQPIQPLADAGGTETVTETPQPWRDLASWY